MMPAFTVILRRSRSLILWTMIACLLLAGQVFAQNPAVPVTQGTSDEPLEITADGSLEWLRKDGKFIARENARAVQGDTAVAAQTLTADYREANGSNFDIWRITAERDVVLTSADSKAYGDRAEYNLDDGVAVLTGQNLRMISPEQTITASDRFEYQVNEARVLAVGDAKVIRPTDTLEADTIKATLEDTPQGERKLKTLEAEKNVVITTPTEILRGDYGIYRAADNKAEIRGNVKLTRGPNVLEGERAEVDLTTNISRIFGSGDAGGRVRGVFYPGSEKKPDNPPNIGQTAQ